MYITKAESSLRVEGRDYDPKPDLNKDFYRWYMLIPCKALNKLREDHGNHFDNVRDFFYKILQLWEEQQISRMVHDIQRVSARFPLGISSILGSSYSDTLTFPPMLEAEGPEKTANERKIDWFELNSRIHLFWFFMH